MDNKIKKYLLYKLSLMRKLEENYEQEQSAIFNSDKKTMENLVKERKRGHEKISLVDKQISNQMNQMGILELDPKNHPLLYQAEKQIDNYQHAIQKKSALNKLMIQFFAMHA